MILNNIEQLKREHLKLLTDIYFHLLEYLELVWPHPSRVGFGGRLYLTNKEESEFRLTTAWANFQKAVAGNSFRDKVTFFEVESDYKEAIRIAEALKNTKKGTETRQKIEKESYDMQEKLQKISMALMQQEAKPKPDPKQK